MTITAPRSWTAKVQAGLNVEPGEGRRVAWMMLYSAAAMGGVLTIGMAAASALFLSELPSSETAHLFILPALFIVPMLVVYNRIAARLPLLPLLIGSNVVLLVLTLGFRLLLETRWRDGFWMLIGIYLFNEISYTLAILQFWTFAGQLFNPRDARRLYGLIAAGGTVATIGAGLSLTALTRWLGVPNLLIVVMGALALCIGSVWALRHAVHTERPAIARSRPPAKALSFVATLRAIGRSPLLLTIATLTILLSLLFNIATYQFFVALQVAFGGNAEAMVAFTGSYGFWSGLVALWVQLYLASRVLRRLGVFAALLLYPLGAIVGAIAALGSGGALWATTFIMGSAAVFRRTINTAAINVLYLAVPSELRQRAAEVLEGLYALSFGLLGVGLLLEARIGLTYVTWSIPTLALAAVWLLVVARARPPYIRALAESIRHRRLDLAAEPINLADPTAVQVLSAALRHADPLQVVHALQLVASAPGVNWDAEVAPLLDHPAPEVRALALAHLSRPGNAQWADAIRARCDDRDEAVRVAAIRALAAVAGAGAAPTLAPLLHWPEPALAGAAIVGLAEHGGAAGAAEATEALQRLLASADAARRLEGARVLGALTLSGFEDALRPLLDDPSPDVQTAAIRAAGATRQSDWIPSLLEKLGDRATMPGAIEALAGYGSAIEVWMADVLDDPLLADWHLGAVKVLQRLGTPGAGEALLAHLDEPDDRARTEIIHALARLHEATPFPFAPEPIRAALAREVEAAYRWRTIEADLGSEGLDPLLAEALAARVRRCLERAFGLFTLLYPGESLVSAHRSLDGEGGAKRAGAVELLDNLLAREDKALLLPLLEAPLAQVADLAHRQLAIPRRALADRLAELACGPDPWLRACALHRIGALRLQGLAAVAREALTDPDDVVRESALVACRALLDPHAFIAAARAQAAAAEPTVSRAYARHLFPEAVHP